MNFVWHIDLINTGGLTMSNIFKLSKYFVCVINGLMALTPSLILLKWLVGQKPWAQNFFNQTIQTPGGAVEFCNVVWEGWAKVIGIFADMIASTPWLIGLIILRKLFLNYKDTNVFSTCNATFYKYLGWLFFMDALFVKSLSDTLRVLAVTLSNPPGQRYISISFGTPNLEALFYGVVLIVISQVMHKAAELHEENKFVI